MRVVLEELNFIDHSWEDLSDRQMLSFTGIPEEVIDYIRVYCLITNSMPGDGEVADVRSTAVEKAHALRVENVEGSDSGILGAELVPNKSVVELAGFGGTCEVEMKVGIRVYQRRRRISSEDVDFVSSHRQSMVKS